MIFLPIDSKKKKKKKKGLTPPTLLHRKKESISCKNGHHRRDTWKLDTRERAGECLFLPKMVTTRA